MMSRSESVSGWLLYDALTDKRRHRDWSLTMGNYLVALCMHTKCEFDYEYLSQSIKQVGIHTLWLNGARYYYQALMGNYWQQLVSIPS